MLGSPSGLGFRLLLGFKKYIDFSRKKKPLAPTNAF